VATRRLVEIVLQGKDQTKGAFDSLANSLGVTDARVLKFAASAAAVTAAVAAATTAVYKFTSAQAEAGDAAAKMSYRLGLTVEGLSELSYVAERGGVQVNTMTMALQRMTRRVAEAAKGTGEAKDAIKELGIDAAALTQLSPDQQFYQIAEALQEVEGQSNRVRLAFKLFDSEGVSVIQTLKGELSETRKEFERYGGAMSASFAAQSEEFANSQSNLSNATKRLKEALAEPFLAPFTAAINSLAWSIAQLQRMKWAFGEGTNIFASARGGSRHRMGQGDEDTPFVDFLDEYGTGQTVVLPNGQVREIGKTIEPPDTSWFTGNPANPYRGYLGMADAGIPMNISPDELGLVGGLDTDFTRGMDDLIAKTEKFSSTAVQVAGTFQNAMASAFATAITDADHAAEAIANIFVSTFAQLAGGWLSSALFGALGLPSFSPFGGGGNKSVNDAAKAMPGSTVLDKAGAYIDMANGAYGKAFI